AGEHRARESTQGGALLGRAVGPAGDDRQGQRDVLERGPAPEPKRADLLVELLDRAGAPPGRGIEDVVARPEVVLLLGEGERPDGAPAGGGPAAGGFRGSRSRRSRARSAPRA